MPTTRATSASGSDDGDAGLRLRAPWRLLRSDQMLLYLLSLAFLAVVAFRYAAGGWPARRPARVLEAGESVEYRVDINRAGPDELGLLPRVGPAIAARIVAYRKAHGPFESLGDLAKVSGISRRMAAGMHGLAVVGPSGSHREPPP